MDRLRLACPAAKPHRKHWEAPLPRAALRPFRPDKTIIAVQHTGVQQTFLSRSGTAQRRAKAESSYAQFIFLLSGADHDQMDRMRTHLTNMRWLGT